MARDPAERMREKYAAAAARAAPLATLAEAARLLGVRYGRLAQRVREAPRGAARPRLAIGPWTFYDLDELRRLGLAPRPRGRRPGSGPTPGSFRAGDGRPRGGGRRAAP